MLSQCKRWKNNNSKIIEIEVEEKPQVKLWRVLVLAQVVVLYIWNKENNYLGRD